MLAVPDTGLRRSVEAHNVNREIVCDWIEGSVLFDDDSLSISDIVDSLCDNGVYADQDFAAQLVADIWSMLAQRRKWLGRGSPFRLSGRKIDRIRSWEEAPALSFCMVLTFSGLYEKWANASGSNYIKQGHLFEKLTKECLESLGWVVYQTGWASGIHTQLFKDIVEGVAAHLSEPFIVEAMVEVYDDANEEGLDLVCHPPFRDNRGGKPVYLVQCASGSNWTQKRKTPDIEVWRKLISFSADPARAFAVPFSLEEKEFLKTCNRVNGMVLERYRLLSPGHRNSDWVSGVLRQELIEWLSPRVSTLPMDSA